MISKVNRPPKLALIRGSKGMQNDPGASSGSGLSYERPPEDQNPDPNRDEKETSEPRLAIVSELEKSGMTEVVLEFLEHKPEAQPNPPGLSLRYQADTSRTKGLLLNKKAE